MRWCFWFVGFVVGVGVGGDGVFGLLVLLLFIAVVVVAAFEHRTRCIKDVGHCWTTLLGS